MTTYLAKTVPDLAANAWELLFQLAAAYEYWLPLPEEVAEDQVMAQRQIFGEELIAAGLAYADHGRLCIILEGEVLVLALNGAYERVRAK
jgi:hypothetical protein